MAELPLDQAVPRFKANEDRLDTFVNSATGYTTSGGVSVQSIQQFLASIGSNGIDFVDNAKARFGTGNDLEIYHSGSGSFIRDTGTGDLTIDGSAISIQTASAERVSVSASGIDVTGTVEFDGLSGTGAVTITDIADEDNMASNSATKLATQQSIKAYVDTQVATIPTGDITSVVAGTGLTGGGTTGDVTLNVIGGTGITANADNIAIDGTVATLTGTQTFTNKTLTSAVLNTSVSGTAVLDEDDMVSDSATKLATQQSIKAYVDANAGGGLPTTGGTMTGDILFNDNVKAKYGTSSDLQIYHDGSNSIIDDSGTGNLYIRSNDVLIDKYTGERMIRAIADGAVTLYHNNAEKLATTSTGIDVTGDIDATGNVVSDGSLRFGSGGSYGAGAIYSDNVWGMIARSYTTNPVSGWDFLFNNSANVERMRLGSAGLRVTGNIELDDNGKLLLGASDDLQLYHDGTHNWIRDVGTGALFLDTNSAIHLYANGSENMLYAQPNAGVQVFYDNVKKFETTSTGIDVTGKIGINNSSPDSNLHIKGTGNNGGIFVEDNSASGSAPLVKVQGTRSDSNESQSFTGALALSSLQSNALANDGKHIGTVYFGANHTDGTAANIAYSASIAARLSGDANSASDMPTDLVFYTGSTGRALGTANVTYGTEGMRIDASGDVSIPSGNLNVTGAIDVANGTTYTTTGDFLAKVQQNSNASGKNGLSVMNAWASNTSTIFEAAMGWNGSVAGYYPVFTIDGLGKTTWKDNFGNVRATIDGSGLDVTGSTITTGTSGTTQWQAGSSANKLTIASYDNNIFYHKLSSGNSTSYQVGVEDNIPIYTITNNTVRTTLLGNGRFGIGTTSPADLFHVEGNIYLGTSSRSVYIGGGGNLRLQTNTGEVKVLTANGATTNLITSGTGINIPADLQVGSTLEVGSLTPNQDGAIEVGVIALGTPAISSTTDSTSLRNHIIFDNPNGAVGKINTLNSATSYLTSSDYRLKTDVQEMTGSIDRVKALRPVNFEWVVDGTRVDGFLAHEAQEVVPEAVDGEKDAMRDQQYVESEATGDIYTPAVEATYETIQVELTPAVEAVYETVTVEISPAVEATYDDDGNELTPAVEAITEEQEQLVTPAVDATYEEQQQELTPAIDEVIHSSDVVEPDTLEEGQLWRETTEKVMATRQVPDYQGIDQSKIVPLLTSALQDAIAKIEALETRLVALEA